MPAMTHSLDQSEASIQPLVPNKRPGNCAGVDVSFLTPALAIISHFPVPAFVSHSHRAPIKSHGHYLLSIGDLSITELFKGESFCLITIGF